MTVPSGDVIEYAYSSSTSSDDVARSLTELKDGAVSLAKYDYLGFGTVVGTASGETEVFFSRTVEDVRQEGSSRTLEVGAPTRMEQGQASTNMGPVELF